VNQITAIHLPDQEELHEYPQFHVTVPDPLTCRPTRAGFTGGRNHDHPSHSSCLVGAGSPSPLVEQDRSCGFTVVSNSPKCAVTFGSRHATFAGLSRKTGEMVSGRGPHELAAWRILETNPSCVSFVLQGSRLTAHSEDASRTHTADYIAAWEDGTITAGEVKANATHFCPPDHRSWMEDVASGYAAYGIEFRRDTGASLRGGARHEFNITSAFGDRFTHVPQDARAEAIEAIERAGGSATLADVEAILDGEPLVARAKAHALLCARAIAFPLTSMLVGDTPVTLPKHPRSIPDIRSLCDDSHDL
jgi:hypothetical protein